MGYRRRSLWVVGLLLLHLVVLAGCARPISYAEIQQTAQARGCWPNQPRFPTPPPVTVTPLVTASPTPVGWLRPSAFPTLPPPITTTPYPRCPPAPGEALDPWPTPVPPQPPYPTMADQRAGGGSGLRDTLQLPEWVLSLDAAAHPTAGWVAVGAAVWSGNANPERAYVSVLNPTVRQWSAAHQVDLGPSALGRYVRTIEVAIEGDNTVHAIWGMSDPDFTDNDPPAGVWAAASADFGATWSDPQRIAADCRQVNDAQATLAGWIVVALVCHDGPAATRPAIVVRRPDGTWLPPERMAAPSWYFSDAAVAIVGDGDAAVATILHLTGVNGTMSAPLALLFQKRLAADEPWRRHASVVTLPGLEVGPWLRRARALVYRPPQAAQDYVTFMWTDATRGRAMAMTSPDGGATWLAPEVVDAGAAGGEAIPWASPLYDPASNRLIASVTCCAEGQPDAPVTHFSRWSTPGSGVWRALADAPARVPLVLGSRSAAETIAVQSRNARQAWVSWVEGRDRVETRALDFQTLIPVGR